MIEKDQKVLNAIQDYIIRNGYPPTVRDLIPMSGLKAPSSVFGCLKRLEKQGYISRNKMTPRAMKVIKNANA